MYWINRVTSPPPMLQVRGIWKHRYNLDYSVLIKVSYIPESRNLNNEIPSS